MNEHFCLFAAFITADTKGKWVVCGSEDNSIFLWDLNKKEVSWLLILQHSLYHFGYTGCTSLSTGRVMWSNAASALTCIYVILDTRLHAVYDQSYMCVASSKCPVDSCQTVIKSELQDYLACVLKCSHDQTCACGLHALHVQPKVHLG